MVAAGRDKLKYPKEQKGTRKRKQSHISCLVKRADGLFSRLIVWRDGACVICGSRGRLECSHFYGKKARPWLRWTSKNAVAMCHDCHMKWHNGNKTEFEAYMKGWLGDEAYTALGDAKPTERLDEGYILSMIDRMEKRCSELCI